MWVRSKYPKDALEILDNTLLQSLEIQDEKHRRKENDKILALMGIAIACTQDSRDDRPNMQEVVRKLERELL